MAEIAPTVTPRQPELQCSHDAGRSATEASTNPADAQRLLEAIRDTYGDGDELFCFARDATTDFPQPHLSPSPRSTATVFSGMAMCLALGGDAEQFIPGILCTTHNASALLDRRRWPPPVGVATDARLSAYRSRDASQGAPELRLDRRPRSCRFGQAFHRRALWSGEAASASSTDRGGSTR